MVFLIPAIMALASAAVSAAGGMASSKATRKAAERQRQVAEMEARNTELQTAENMNRMRANAQRRLARLRSGAADSGVVSTSGSTAEVFAETEGRLELEVQDAARSGAMEAQNIRSAGENAAWEGRARAAAMKIKTYGTLISDVGRAARSAYLDMK